MSYLLEIESLDLEGRGVAHHNGKVVFVDGALPGELVRAQVTRQKTNYDRAKLLEVIRPSSQRVEPPCPSFGICGGCVMQHLEPAAQVAIKQRALEDAFTHIGKVKPKQMLAAMHGPYFGYRYRARFSARFVQKKGGMLVGFRERNSSYVMDMDQCLVVPAAVSDLLRPLRDMLGTLSRPDRIPQIELAVGDACMVLTLRHLEPLTDTDMQTLLQFGQTYQVSWWLQPKGPDSVHPLVPEDVDRLYYDLPDYGLRMPFKPTDFTQVNHQINRELIRRALRLLAIEPTDRVADLFCGLGNFSLPMARFAKEVVGIEGSTALTERATEAAVRHELDHKTQFSTLNLFEVDQSWLRELGYFDRVLIDPPRDGALAVAKAYSALSLQERPKRIVYVSCNPATLARDAGILVHVGGYELQAAGVINMFPHTGHIESIAVFEAGQTGPLKTTIEDDTTLMND